MGGGLALALCSGIVFTTGQFAKLPATLVPSNYQLIGRSKPPSPNARQKIMATKKKTIE